MPTLEESIEKIEQRNKRVETDKAWEVSITRRILLIIFTYLSIGIYMSAIQVPNAWLNAIVPAIGFLLSTLTLPFFKKVWVRYRNKNMPKN